MEKIMYLRKSQKDRVDPNETIEQTLERHEKQLQEYAYREFGHYIEEKYIFREVISGGEEITERAEFLKVLKLVEQNKVSHCLFLDTARISRTGIYGAGDIINTFFYTNTLICTPAKIYNLSDEYDKKFLEMELIQSADYLAYTKKVLMRGRTYSVKSLGLFVGSIAPYGYDKKKLDKGYTLTPNSDADTVKMIFEMCLNGTGTTKIADYLNELNVKPKKSDIWTPQIVRNILTTETYAGMLTWKKRPITIKIENGKKIKTRPKAKDYILVKGLHEGLVSKEEFDEAQIILKSHPSSKITKSNELKNPLAGIVYCSCNRIMIRRPYTKSFKKYKERKYNLDKEKILNLLRTHKEQSGLSINQLARLLNVSRDSIVAWFPTSVKKFYPSIRFSEKWYEIKEILNIETDEFDKAITTFKEPEIPEDTLMCSIKNCGNVSSNLKEVEKAIISALNDHLRENKYFLDNYAEEIEKVIVGNTRKIENLNKKIDKLKKEKRNALRNYNAEDITREEYLELKQDIEVELSVLETEKAKLEKNKQEDKIIKIKKSIPILSKCIQNYDKVSIEEKNQLLKSIISKVIYTKKEKSTKNKTAKFELEIHTKL